MTDASDIYCELDSLSAVHFTKIKPVATKKRKTFHSYYILLLIIYELLLVMLFSPLKKFSRKYIAKKKIYT